MYDITEIIFLVMVGVGIIIMATNVIRYWHFMKTTDSIFSQKKKLRQLGMLGEILLVCFLLGYIVVFFTKELHELVIAGILCGGSIYVCIILTIMFQMVKTILHQLEYDSVTDLPNRRFLNNYEERKELVSVAIIDINDFKYINEKYGHTGGDAVLVTVADRLKKHPDYRASRIGADEFLVQFDTDISRHPEIGSRIHRELGAPIEYNGHKIIVSCSIGCATKRNNETLEELITDADIAVYKAKQDKTRKFWVHYSDELRNEIDHRREIIEALDRAINEELFEIVYQPQIVLKDEKMCAFEVLCRFPDNKYLPEEFIPIAEETEQIIPIGRMITEMAVRQLGLWDKEGFEVPNIFINYSAVQLKDPGYCEFIHDLLNKYHISSDRVKLEITERIPMGENRVVDDFFRQTREYGIELALDDFGTGYSSMGALMDYPVNCVKLDRTVNEKYLQKGKDVYIRHIIELAHGLGKVLVAEGVETKEQQELAFNLGVDEVQGFYYSKPLSPEQAADWLKKKGTGGKGHNNE